MSGTPVVIGPPRFADRADKALGDEALRSAVRNATQLLVDNRAAAFAGLAEPDLVRDAARAARTRILAKLPELLDQWSSRLEAHGGQVHWCADAEEAVAEILAIVEARGARVIAKGKSMASEEIHLNPALERLGKEVVETDLGEFIIQLAGETPSHLIAPAIHKNRFDVAELFSADAGRPISNEIPEEAAYARVRLRQAFLDADIGITGVNTAVADAGSICLVENEGNGRMCTSLPPVHIAIMGMERIVETWADLDLVLALLARSATGQALSVYTNVITGPRREGELDGPEELHVIVLDNGRSALLGGEFQEALNCIRCGACVNACPVYRQVGGHAYGSVYSGPIGAVLTPLLAAEDPAARELAEASSLCGACAEACPVRIPLHDLLQKLRARSGPADAGRARRVGFTLWSWLWASRPGYVLSTGAVRAVSPVLRRLPPAVSARLPGWAGAWARTRRLP
ncbi:MAG: LutB/LldF family L-lactate oxidation iron-sulfur protein [Acidimicrobiales bacterium]